MKIKLLRFPHKAIRASVIKNYMRGKWEKAVCFSCGNAAAELERAGVDVLHIGPHGVLSPRKWFGQAEIHNIFPFYFDATSGHLPAELMAQLGFAYAAYLGELPKSVYLPTGSGETLVCLKSVYPGTKFYAVYNLDEATKYEPLCPLNTFVVMASAGIIDAEKAAEEGVVFEDGKTATQSHDCCRQAGTQNRRPAPSAGLAETHPPDGKGAIDL